MTLHPTNLNSNTIETDLYKIHFLYEKAGKVQQARNTVHNRSGGRAVDMLLKNAGEKAILKLHRSNYNREIIPVLKLDMIPMLMPAIHTFEASPGTSDEHKNPLL